MIDDVLGDLAAGRIDAKEAKKRIRIDAVEEIAGIAKLDVGRESRRGIPEVVFAESKQLRDILSIVSRAVESSGSAVVSRIRKEHMEAVLEHAAKIGTVETGRNCSTVHVHSGPLRTGRGVVGVLAAGTSDVGVAEEARLMAESMGCSCVAGYDVGIAGMHRLAPELRKFAEAGVSAVVVAAGMEGALATVVASLSDVPVVGVPVSVGYGHGGAGEGALTSMLQSCALGLAVVNIDNGVSAGAFAASVARSRAGE